VGWATVLQQMLADRRGDEAAADTAFEDIIHDRHSAAIGAILDRLASAADGAVETEQTQGQTGDSDGNAGLQITGGTSEPTAGV